MIAMNEQNNIDTLEQMRSEMAGFKAALEQQKIVNDKMMRRAMQKDYSKERGSVSLTAGLSLLGLLALVPPTFVGKLIPVWFFVASVIFMASCLGFSLYMVRRYLSDDLMSGEVVTVAENILNYKRINNRWLAFFGIPVLVAWSAAFFWVISAQAGEFAHGMLLGGIVGLVIGGIFATIYYVDYLRRINRMLQQIDEIRGASKL